MNFNRRDLLKAGRRPISSARLLLHAETLRFVHPVTGAHLRWTSDPPPDFVEILQRLQR